jgi:hypothetical protein
MMSTGPAFTHPTKGTARHAQRESLVAAALCSLALGRLHDRDAQALAADLKQQVADTERAFAKTMADRNHAAFSSFLADDTIFFTSKARFAASRPWPDFWKKFYDGPGAVLVGARNGRGAGLGDARAVVGTGSRSAGQASRRSRRSGGSSVGNLEDHLRQGQRSLRLPESPEAT